MINIPVVSENKVKNLINKAIDKNNAMMEKQLYSLEKKIDDLNRILKELIKKGGGMIL